MTQKTDADNIQNPFIGFAIIFTSFISFCGNSVILIVTKKNKVFKERNQTRLFIANLAFVNLMSTINSFIQGAGYIRKNYVDQGFICYYSAYTLQHFRYLSVLSVTLLTINRYYAVVKTGRAEGVFDTYSSWCYILGAHAWSGIANGLLIYVNNTPRYHKKFGMCTICGNLLRSLNISVNNLFVTPGIFIVFYCNIAMWRFVRRHNHEAKRLGVTKAVLQQRNWRVTRMISIIVVSFALCWVTSVIIMMTIKTLTVERLLRLIFNINFASNFFVYALMDQEFRKNVERLLPRPSCGQRL